MAASPVIKVYQSTGEYLASFKYPEHAAMLVAGMGDKGATIREGHGKGGIFWTEGIDGYAGESFDAVAEAYDNRQFKCAYCLKRGTKTNPLVQMGELFAHETH